MAHPTSGVSKAIRSNGDRLLESWCLPLERRSLGWERVRTGLYMCDARRKFVNMPLDCEQADYLALLQVEDHGTAIKDESRRFSFSMLIYRRILQCVYL